MVYPVETYAKINDMHPNNDSGKFHKALIQTLEVTKRTPTSSR